MLDKAFKLLNFVWNHPYNRGGRLSAIGRVLRWQIASRLMSGPIAFPFVNGTYLFATKGMMGATGNWYCGLHEYEEMSFLMHWLCKGDLFLDVGANIGSYSILAAGLGAEVVAVEPIPITYNALIRNILLNDFSSCIRALNIGLGKETARLRLSADKDTINHVIANDEVAGTSLEVSIQKLDDILYGRIPSIIKIDVEGYEAEVIAGAEITLRSQNLKAVIIELSGLGVRYGFDDSDLYDKFFELGFVEVLYDPSTMHCLIATPGENRNRPNKIFLRRAFLPNLCD